MAKNPPKVYTLAQCKAEILKRIGRSRVRSVASMIRLGGTADAVIEDAFRELRDEGKIWSRDKRWFLRDTTRALRPRDPALPR
jgi:hypothetical protein